MKHGTATFVQLKICGISEHSKTAFENFLDEKTSLLCLSQRNIEKWVLTSSIAATRKLLRPTTLVELRFQLTKRSFIQESMTSNGQI